MDGHLVASGAEFLDLHFGEMGFLVPGADVVVLAALTAFQDDIVTLAFGCHVVCLSSYFASEILP
jgi:hypothetical protein